MQKYLGLNHHEINCADFFFLNSCQPHCSVQPSIEVFRCYLRKMNMYTECFAFPVCVLSELH